MEFIIPQKIRLDRIASGNALVNLWFHPASSLSSLINYLLQAAPTQSNFKHAGSVALETLCGKA